MLLILYDIPTLFSLKREAETAGNQNIPHFQREVFLKTYPTSSGSFFRLEIRICPHHSSKVLKRQLILIIEFDDPSGLNQTFYLRLD